MILAAALGSALLAGCSSTPKETTAAATEAATTAEEKKEESKAEETTKEEKKEEAASGKDMLSGETGDIAKPGDGKGQKVVLITNRLYGSALGKHGQGLQAGSRRTWL